MVLLVECADLLHNGGMIDPRLKVLQMVDRHGTVTAAAAALNYTPSAVSYQLRQLSADLGADLVAPQGRGIRLTAAAFALLDHAEGLFAEAERARAALAAADGDPRGRFTVCGFSTAAMRLLPPAAAALRERFPHVRLRVIEAEPERCFDLLAAEEADLALVVNTADTPAYGDDRFDRRHLFDDPLDLVVPRGHRFAGAASVGLAEAAEESWIVGQPGGAYHGLVLSACLAAGFTPRIDHYADEWSTGTALVAYGFGIILVPRLARLIDAEELVRVPLHGDPAPARPITAALRNGGRGHPVLAAALEEITRLAGELVPSGGGSGAVGPVLRAGGEEEPLQL